MLVWKVYESTEDQHKMSTNIPPGVNFLRQEIRGVHLQSSKGKVTPLLPPPPPPPSLPPVPHPRSESQTRSSASSSLKSSSSLNNNSNNNSLEHHLSPVTHNLLNRIPVQLQQHHVQNVWKHYCKYLI